MELMAVIVALEAIKPGTRLPVTIYSDSKYVIDSVEKGWLAGWVKKDFKDKKNPDLWKRFLLIYPKYKVKFVWVKGHAGIAENERCDQLAVQSSYGPTLLIDEGYENDISRRDSFLA
jgi:ribonuclease HI